MFAVHREPVLNAFVVLPLFLVHQFSAESVNEFCLPPASGKACHAAGPVEADLRRGKPSPTWVSRNASLEIKCNARRFIHPELDDREEAVGFVVREKG
jgi:hypothetical protein